MIIITIILIILIILNPRVDIKDPHYIFIWFGRTRREFFRIRKKKFGNEQ